MIKSFFSTLSYIFHPIFLPIIGLFFLFTMPSLTPGLLEKSLYAADPEAKKVIYLIFTTLMVVAPGISIMIMYWSKVIGSLKMETKEERIYPLITVLIYSTFCYVYLRRLVSSQPNYQLLLSYVFGILIVIAICFLINFYLKISLHAAGIFGLIGAIIGYFNVQANYNLPFIIVLVLIGGLVSAGRIYLRAHSNTEILLGILIGFTIQFFCMKFEWFL